MSDGKTRQDLAHGITDHCGRRYFVLLLCSRKVEGGILCRNLSISLVSNPMGVDRCAKCGAEIKGTHYHPKWGEVLLHSLRPSRSKEVGALSIDITGVDLTLPLRQKFTHMW
jgi:hypothetical protein